MNNLMAPSRKWMVARVTAIAAFFIAWIEAGEWTSTLSIMLVGIVSEGIISYLTPNPVPEEETPEFA